MIARRFFPELRLPTYYQTEVKLPSLRVGSFTEDPELFWKPLDNFNSQTQRLRNIGEESIVYTFGGSIAAGAGAQTNFSKILENRLQATEKKVRVVNFGVAGYTTYQNLILLKRALVTTTPRLVILCNAFNDSTPWTYLSDRQAGERNQTASVKALALLNHSRLFVLFRYSLLKTRKLIAALTTKHLRPYREYRVTRDEYRENLATFAALAQQYGFTLIFLTQEMPNSYTQKKVDRYNDIMRQSEDRQNRVYLVDARPYFRQYRTEHRVPYQEVSNLPYDELFADAVCHPSDKGHEIYAEALFDAIRAEHMLN